MYSNGTSDRKRVRSLKVVDKWKIRRFFFFRLFCFGSKKKIKIWIWKMLT